MFKFLKRHSETINFAVLIIEFFFIAGVSFKAGRKWEHISAFEEGVDEARSTYYQGIDSPEPPPIEVTDALEQEIGDVGHGVWRLTFQGWLFQPSLKWYTIDGALNVKAHTTFDEDRAQ